MGQTHITWINRRWTVDGGIIYIGSIEKPTKDFFFNFCILLYKQVFLEKHTQKYGEVIDFSFPYHITPCNFNGIIYTTGFLRNIRMLIYVYIRSMAEDRIRSMNRSKKSLYIAAPRYGTWPWRVRTNHVPLATFEEKKGFFRIPLKVIRNI